MLGYDVPTPRRSDRTDSGLWDGITSEGKTEATNGKAESTETVA